MRRWDVGLKESTSADLNLKVWKTYKSFRRYVADGVLQWPGFIAAKQNHPNPHFFRKGKVLLDFYLFLIDYGL